MGLLGPRTHTFGRATGCNTDHAYAGPTQTTLELEKRFAGEWKDARKILSYKKNEQKPGKSLMILGDSTPQSKT